MQLVSYPGELLVKPQRRVPCPLHAGARPTDPAAIASVAQQVCSERSAEAESGTGGVGNDDSQPAWVPSCWRRMCGNVESIEWT